MTDVSVVIAAYRPGPSLVRLVSAVASVYTTFVVDDGSGPDHDEVLAGARAAGAEILRLPENGGIAAALNRGLQSAFARGATAVFTFDQDSFPEADTLQKLAAARHRAQAAGERIGLLVPGRFADVSQSRDESEWADARRVIQSGMLVPRETYIRLGPLREDLFIDLVDTDYELRALTSGLRVVAVRDTGIEHELGSTVRLLPFGRRLGWLGVRTMVSSPFRYYYRARNRVVLLRRFGRRMPVRLLVDTVIDGVYLVVVGFSARPRRDFALLVRRGIGDGWSQSLGKMAPDLQQRARRITWSREPDAAR